MLSLNPVLLSDNGHVRVLLLFLWVRVTMGKQCDTDNMQAADAALLAPGVDL